MQDAFRNSTGDIRSTTDVEPPTTKLCGMRRGPGLIRAREFPVEPLSSTDALRRSAPLVKLRTRNRVLLGLLLGLVVSAILLWLAVRNADFGEVRSVLARADIGFVALAIASLAVFYAGQALRWSAIARTPQVSPVRFGEMVVSGVAVNNVLPGRIGDLLRARWLQVAARIPGGRALATVFVDRAFDVFALVAFLAISLVFVSSAEWLLRMAVGGLILFGAIALILIVSRAYTRRRARDRRAERSFLRRIARDLIEGLAEPLGMSRTLTLAGLSLATWAMWGLAASFVARAVGIELSVVEAIFLTAVINLGVAIPSSPGFIGTYQWLGVTALSHFDVATEQALAFAILMHAVWYVPTTVVGGALLVRRGLKRSMTGLREAFGGPRRTPSTEQPS